MPAVRIVHISELVIWFKYGFTVRADSTPTKTLLAATNDSAPDILISLVKIYAKPLITKGIMLKKYKIAMRAEKKIIVGNAWKAKLNPSEVSPVSLTCPGASASLPKTNFAPAEAESKIFITASFKKRNSLQPAGTTKINQAINICRIIPQIITLKFMFFLSDEKIQAIPIKINIPKKLIRL